MRHKTLLSAIILSSALLSTVAMAQTAPASAIVDQVLDEFYKSVSQECLAVPNSSPQQLREAYKCQVSKLQELEDAVLARIPVLQNKETRTTAQEAEDVVSRMMHAARRRIGERFKGMAPSFLRGVIYLRNQYMYSDPLGPTYEYLRKKGKTAGSIIESAKRTGGENLGLKSPFILSLLNAIDSGLKLVGLL